jgi:hypothetical protein
MSKQLTIDRLRVQLAKTEADRDVLAAEVEAWIKWFHEKARVTNRTEEAQEDAQVRLNEAQERRRESGALTRAKEAK